MGKQKTIPAAFDELVYMDGLNGYMADCLSLIRTVKRALEQDEELSYLAITLAMARDKIDACHELTGEWWDKAATPRLEAQRKRQQEEYENRPFSPLDESACARMEALVIRSREENAALAKLNPAERRQAKAIINRVRKGGGSKPKARKGGAQ